MSEDEKWEIVSLEDSNYFHINCPKCSADNRYFIGSNLCFCHNCGQEFFVNGRDNHSITMVDMNKMKTSNMGRKGKSLFVWCKENNDDKLLNEWDTIHNTNRTPSSITAKNGNKVFWICSKCGLSWPMTVNNRAYGHGCPLCGNDIVVKGINDIATTRPDLILDWDYENNRDVTPYTISMGSSRYIFWKCHDCGHKWKTKMYTRGKSNHVCPECAKEIISLKKMQPKPGKSFYEWCIEKNKEYLLDEWDTENNDNNPRDYKYASDRSVNWVCSVCGHRWTSSIKNRTLANSGCTKCGVETVRKCRMTPKKGESLAEVLPKVAEEWHPTKNSKLTPKDVKYGSAREFYWLCPRCGEEWKDSVCHRLMGRSCPNCSKHRRVSFNEKAIYVGLKKTFPEIEMIENYRNKPCGITEIDIFIPSISLGIEYDGRRHHQYLEKDLKKDRACKENGIKLIRVKEYFSTYFGPTPDYWIYKSGSEKELTDVIKKIEKLIAIRCGIEKYKSKCDVKKNRIEIYDCIIQYDSKNKLSVDYPEIAKEWHPTKNGKTKPEFVSSKTHRKYWWKCSVCGHEWEAKVENRTVNKSGCPECKKQKRIV